MQPVPAMEGPDLLASLRDFDDRFGDYSVMGSDQSATFSAQKPTRINRVALWAAALIS
jgi:hypothetical protein